MAIRQLRYDGDEILRKKSRKVEEVDDKIRELMNDMVETMHAENGVGLSAVQVGILKRVIVIDLYDGTEPLKLVNPEILKVKGHRLVEEGCLSFPNKFALVDRPIEVTVKALNENGDEIKIKGAIYEKGKDYHSRRSTRCRKNNNYRLFKKHITIH